MTRWLAACSLLIAGAVPAQTAPDLPPSGIRQQEIVCNTEEAIFTVAGRYGEVPVMAGRAQRDGKSVVILLLVNPTTWSWTYAEERENGAICVLATGEDLMPIEESLRQRFIQQYIKNAPTKGPST